MVSSEGQWNALTLPQNTPRLPALVEHTPPLKWFMIGDRRQVGCIDFDTRWWGLWVNAASAIELRLAVMILWPDPTLISNYLSPEDYSIEFNKIITVILFWLRLHFSLGTLFLWQIRIRIDQNRCLMHLNFFVSDRSFPQFSWPKSTNAISSIYYFNSMPNDSDFCSVPASRISPAKFGLIQSTNF